MWYNAHAYVLCARGALATSRYRSAHEKAVGGSQHSPRKAFPEIYTTSAIDNITKKPTLTLIVHQDPASYVPATDSRLPLFGNSLVHHNKSTTSSEYSLVHHNKRTASSEYSLVHHNKRKASCLSRMRTVPAFFLATCHACHVSLPCCDFVSWRHARAR